MNTNFLLSSDNNNRNELLKKKIIHYYIANGDATIADLGREMDLSIPTVTKLVAELQDDGYILDFGKQKPVEDVNRISMALIRHPATLWESICLKTS